MKYTNFYSKTLAVLAALFALNITSGLAFGAVACSSTTAAGVVAVPVTSQDSDHIYFDSHDSNFAYDAVYHIQENFLYMTITAGQSSSAVRVSGTFLLSGVGFKPTLTYNQGQTFAQLDCSN